MVKKITKIQTSLAKNLSAQKLNFNHFVSLKGIPSEKFEKYANNLTLVNTRTDKPVASEAQWGQNYFEDAQ